MKSAFAQLIAVLQLALVSAAFAGNSPGDKLERIQNLGPNSSAEGIALCRALRSEMEGATPEQWTTMMRVLDDRSKAADLRYAVFELAAATGDRAQIAALVRTEVPRWADQAAADMVLFRKSGRTVDSLPPTCLAATLDHAATAPTKGWADAPDALVEVIERCLAMEIVVDLRRVGSKSTLPQVLATLPVPADSASAVAEKTLLRDPMRGAGGDPRLSELLRPDAITRLRSHLEVIPSNPTDYPWAIADALSHIGDIASVPFLERARDSYTASPFVMPGGTQRLGPGAAQGINELLRKIRAQNPPAALLQLIAQADDGLVSATKLRMWAVERALRLGLDKAEVRTALLSYVNGRFASKDGEGRPEKAMTSANLSDLKACARRLGILQPGDLDGIPDPIVGPGD